MKKGIFAAFVSALIFSGICFAEDGKGIPTPSDAEKLNKVESAGNVVITYNSKADVDTAFAAQAKLIVEAGWKDSYHGMNAPMKAANIISQTFSANKRIISLSAMTDSMNAGLTLISMSETADPMPE